MIALLTGWPILGFGARTVCVVFGALLNTAIGLFTPATLSYHLDLPARAVVATRPQATGRSGTAT